MTTISRWALQGVAVFLFAWMAAVAGQWNSDVTEATRFEHLSIASNSGPGSSETAPEQLDLKGEQ
jgi:hypothetical protein